MMSALVRKEGQIPDTKGCSLVVDKRIKHKNSKAMSVQQGCKQYQQYIVMGLKKKSGPKEEKK
jgi:hypothetical protein